jgi:hypothetical protein
MVPHGMATRISLQSFIITGFTTFLPQLVVAVRVSDPRSLISRVMMFREFSDLPQFLGSRPVKR